VTECGLRIWIPDHERTDEDTTCKACIRAKEAYERGYK
jgi:hypothetical protein